MKSLTNKFFVYYPESFRAIEKLLQAHGFKINQRGDGYYRAETGCGFQFMSLNNYKTVLDFQIDYPYYSIKD